MMNTVVTIGDNRFALPTKKAHALLELLAEAVEVKQEWQDGPNRYKWEVRTEYLAEIGSVLTTQTLTRDTSHDWA